MDPLPRRDSRATFLKLEGRPAAPGRACGPIVRNERSRRPDEVAGGVLVTERAVPDDVPRILSACGTLTLGGSLLSHVSLLSREFGRPSVCLRGELAAGLVPDDGSGRLVRMGAVVGGGPPVLHEGDIVLLDGDEGTVHVPGGFDRERATRIREAWDALASYAAVPDRDRLVRVVETLGTGGRRRPDFVVEAVLFYDALPPGPTRGALFETLRSGTAPWIEPVEVDALAERVVRTARRDAERIREEARGLARPDELDRLRVRLDRLRERVDARLVDLGVDPDAVERAFWGEAARAIDARHDDLRSELRGAVVEIEGLSDDALDGRLGDAHRLLRRATSAGIADTALGRARARVDRRMAELRGGVGDRLVVGLERGASVVERGLVGGKAAGLLAIAGSLPAHARIPRGFVVTTLAYRLHVLGEVGARLEDALASGADAATVSRAAKAAILAAEMPQPIVDAIRDAHARLGTDRVAVRSSSTIEDGPGGSLAGQHDSWLGVRGVREAVDRTRWCWASMWNGRALRTLAAMGRSPLEAAQAVLVQELVDTRAAGVLATRDPSGIRDCMIVNAVRGLGEGISQGAATGDLYWVRLSDGTVVNAEPAARPGVVTLDPNGAGTIERPVSADVVGRPCLDDGELARLAELARLVVDSGGGPREVEFGFTGSGELVVFQDRGLSTGTS